MKSARSNGHRGLAKVLPISVLLWAAGCATSPLPALRQDTSLQRDSFPNLMSVANRDVPPASPPANEKAVNTQAPHIEKTIQATNSFRVEAGAPIGTGRTIEFKPGLSLDPAVTHPNEVISGKLLFSGIFIEAVKTSNPLQLLNPFAGRNYSPEDNVTRDLDGKISGLKLFSIGF